MSKLKTAIIVDIDGTLMNNEESHKHKEEIARGDFTWFRKEIPGENS